MDKQTKKGNESKDSNLWGALTFSSLAIIIIWLLSWWLLYSQIKDITERGIFGDKFGVLNALFSGLAFAGLIITLHYQQKSLNYKDKS